MNYKQYINILNESLNSAKAKFSGSEEKFEQLKILDPTANKKWKYMDFIVKVGFQDDLLELLTKFEKLTNKGIIGNKDINNYTYESLKDEINFTKNIKTQRQQKIDIKKDVIVVSQNPLVIIPLTKEASILYGKNTKWCTSALKGNRFDEYFIGRDLTLFYVIDKNKWAVALDSDGNLNSCWNAINNNIDIDGATENTGIVLEDFQRWFQENKNIAQNVKMNSPNIIFYYVNLNNIDGIKKLIKNNINIDIQNNYGVTPLFNACFYEHVKIIKLLLGNDVKKTINIQDKYGRTPLLYVCYDNNETSIETVRLLLDNKEQKSVNTKDEHGRTPLIWACFNGNIEIVKLLLDDKEQKSVNTKDKNGDTPLSFAKQYNYQEIVGL